MYTKILVPLDGSRLSETVLPYARSLVRDLKVPVELLQVIEPEIVSTFADPAHARYVDVVEVDMKRNSLDYLDRLAGSFPGAPSVICSAEIGNPPEVIVNRGAADPGILIAMSTRGRSGIQRWVLGSVTNKVLHLSSNHLLIVRGDEKSKTDGEATLESLIVPLDGSPLAEKALRYSLELARNLKLELVLLRVYGLPTSTYYVSDEYTPDLGQLTEQVREEARKYLESKVETLRGEGLEKCSSLLLQGDAAEEIIDTARKTQGNLVAMCTHGRSGLSRWVLGSVTERVVLHSGDPVLVIPATE
ncbi:MAG: universal stress protein [Deltaproteobacteria bacterium]|nr:universal stress protein [Deltaproteobacteria bacterium]